MAVRNLYGNWDGFPAHSVSFISDALEKENYEAVYAAVMEEEKNSKDMLVQFGEKYPGVTTQSNVNEILAFLKAGKPLGGKKPTDNKDCCRRADRYGE